jgi:multicomponent Na+:H+ antiporter subunit C
MVGVLFAAGVYLLLRRDSIKLLLGLGLLSYAINLLLFGSGKLKRGLPPIIADKAAFDGDISTYVDPLPQALILTAIVISFGVTAFVVVLINRRYALSVQQRRRSQSASAPAVGDPFASSSHYLSGLDSDPDDYEWIEYSPTGELRLHESAPPPHSDTGDPP